MDLKTLNHFIELQSDNRPESNFTGNINAQNLTVLTWYPKRELLCDRKRHTAHTVSCSRPGPVWGGGGGAVWGRERGRRGDTLSWSWWGMD